MMTTGSRHGSPTRSAARAAGQARRTASLAPTRRAVVLSLRPRYLEAILAGKKTVELRRRFSASVACGTVVFLYGTSPVSAMVGTASVREVLALPVERIWTEFGGRAFVGRESFERYLAGLDRAFAIVLEDVRPFSRPLSLRELRAVCDFTPPQSYCYAKHDYRTIADGGIRV